MNSIHKESIKFTQTIYVVLCVLELSKYVMYEWFYDKMQLSFGKNKLKSQKIDTDFLTFSCKAIKILNEGSKHFKEGFDFSELDPSHELYSENNKKSLEK